MTRILNEITGQVTATCGLAMDADELRLVWANARGAAMTIDRRLSVEQFFKNITPPSWCRKQNHGPNVGPTIFTDFSQPYILRVVCRRRLPLDPSD